MPVQGNATTPARDGSRQNEASTPTMYTKARLQHTHQRCLALSSPPTGVRTRREHSPSTRGHARVTSARRIPLVCGAFVAAVTRPCPRFPSLDPARPVNEAVQLDEWQAKTLREVPSECRLTVPTRTRDDRDLPHEHHPAIATVPERRLERTCADGTRVARLQVAGSSTSRSC
jgi:hypothetical protein